MEFYKYSVRQLQTKHTITLYETLNLREKVTETVNKCTRNTYTCASKLILVIHNKSAKLLIYLN